MPEESRSDIVINRSHAVEESDVDNRFERFVFLTKVIKASLIRNLS